MNVGFENQPVYTKLTIGTAAVGVSAAQMPGSSAGLVYLKAPAANTGTVTLGSSSGVTAGAGWTLTPGAEAPLMALNSLNMVWVISDQAAQSIEYIVKS